jgi:hypothetical protein
VNELVSQIAVVPVQRILLLALHVTHMPVSMLQAGKVVDGHALGLALPLSPSHPTQLPVLEHTGLVASFVQFAALRHSTQLLEASQIGVAGEFARQVASSVHATQKPLLQTGVGALHWLLSVHCAVQTWLLQNGFSGSVQSAAWVAALHSTHLWSVVSQTGFPGMFAHAVASVALHSRQLPETQAGSVVVGQAEVAPDPWSPLHATHCLFVQTGAVAGQVLLSTQLTHTLLSQMVLPGVRSLEHATVPLHWAQAPVPRHAGSAAVHGNLDAEPKSPVQPTQRF